jgi:hypothetical protein
MDAPLAGNGPSSSGHLLTVGARRTGAVAAILIAVLLPATGCTGRGHTTHTAEHPDGCQVWDEGPSVPAHPSALTPPPTLMPILRQQFQTDLLTRLSPASAIADDPRVLKFLQVRHEPNGHTYTEFQAVGVGTTTVHAAQLGTGNTPTTTLRLTVTVRCR